MENFNVSVGGHDLIVDGSVTLSFGRRYGLVGRNGTGKTTFLRYMAMHAIDGIPPNCQILHVEQEELRELDLEDENGKSRGDLNGVPDKDAILQRLEQIYKRLEVIDADSAESRAASILAVRSQFLSRNAAEGNQNIFWRMQIALARALFIEPDMLLLDEPTNHLDLHAVQWLESYLVKWPKTFSVVSHAREFLNTVVTDIIHLQGQKLTAYKGNYSSS
ncbi:hypothetical protein CRYUN_Cryun07bG0136700 [Craigia yunnanensis]